TNMLLKAQRGEWPGGLAPYGYTVAVLDGRRFLAPGDPQEVEVVRWMFDKVANHGWSLADIRDALHARGVRPPTTLARAKNRAVGVWPRGSIGRILRNRVYVGDLAFNRRRKGKYSYFADGQVSVSDCAQTKASDNERGDWIVRENTHAPLVDRDTFQRA